jgi:hypothetical protein
MARISLITSRKLGVFSQRDIVPAIRQVATGQLEGGITPQIIEIIGIFVAARDGQDASAQDVRKRMNNPCRVAPIGDLRSKPVGDADASLRQSQRRRRN